MVNLLQVVALVVVFLSCEVCGKDCGFPNGTTTAIHFYNCEAGAPVLASALKVTDKTGQVVYPTHIYHLYVKMDLENTGGTFDKLLADVGVNEYKSSIFKPECHWNPLPTFGLTDNLNFCDLSPDACPLKPDKSSINVFLDLSGYKPIIALLSEAYTYELVFRLHTADKKVVGCMALQTRIVKQ